MPSSSLSRLPPVHVEADLLSPDDHRALLDDALANEADQRPSAVALDQDGEIVRGTIDVDIRRGGSRTLTNAQRRLFKQIIMARQDKVAEALGLSFPAKPGLELEAVHSGDGAFFVPHVDTMRGGRASHRVISAVYYYSRRPRAFSGGELRLWSLDGSSSKLIEPTDNSMVFFPSIFRHEVLPVSVPSGEFADGRFSINCWIHRIV